IVTRTSSTEAQNQDQDGSRNENSEPNGNKELTWNKRLPQTKDHRDNVDGQKLKRHKRAHLDKRRFSCKLCGKSFIYKSLTCHMRTHTGEKPYPCKTCGKCFSRSDNLTTHMRTHTGEKPYPCKTCGKCFSMGSHLTSHMKTHTGEKPYPCKTCGKCFSRRSHLTCHMKIHHSNPTQNMRINTIKEQTADLFIYLFIPYKTLFTKCYLKHLLWVFCFTMHNGTFLKVKSGLYQQSFKKLF
uniref:C2H2-type domain-containing protein n=1 Tax=Nothobranchius furzeri TaxID=105023 RepID=A0A8C6M7B4_NOTFU